jgi:protein-tyrosine-phosphatase
MADNVEITAGSGVEIAADDIAGVLVQRVKLQWGVDGTAVDASAAAPLPVTVVGDAATPLTDTELRAADVVVSLDDEIVDVLGPLTDTELRAADVVVSLDGEEISVTGPLTDTELRATAVPVSGPLTDTELRAADVVVSLDGEDVTVIEKVIPLTTVTGTINTSGANTIIAAPGSDKRLAIAELSFQLEGATATTVIVLSDAVAQRRWYLSAAGAGVTWVYDQGREIRLLENDALIFNLSGANSVGYTVRYFEEAI